MSPFDNFNDFLVKYNIDKTQFDESNIDTNELIKIYNNYILIENNLSLLANDIINKLQNLQEVHSVKTRIKNPEHLIEKIIRKKINNPNFFVNEKNYINKITDLIGIRILHLFKSDWYPIDAFIKKLWSLKEKPIANVREGDSKDIINNYKQKGCKIKNHEFGYRSIHYIIELKIIHESLFAEIQVRTLFEEGWSEIDHLTRYPYYTDNVIFNYYLSLLNRISGIADEMGTFMQFLKVQHEEQINNYDNEIKKRDATIEELKSKIDKLSITQKSKKDLNKEIEMLIPLIKKNITIPKDLYDFMKINTEIFNNKTNESLKQALEAVNKLQKQGGMTDLIKNFIDAQNYIKQNKKKKDDGSED
ncbi:MAG: GTP pyrophosphokinase [Spirochaetes bacterium]|nr:GTP pyrophosphokinase [Spirochaetota bacterium]